MVSRCFVMLVFVGSVGSFLYIVVGMSYLFSGFCFFFSKEFFLMVISGLLFSGLILGLVGVWWLVGTVVLGFRVFCLSVFFFWVMVYYSMCLDF